MNLLHNQWPKKANPPELKKASQPLMLLTHPNEPVPQCHKREAKKESKIATKVSNKRLPLRNV